MRTPIEGRMQGSKPFEPAEQNRPPSSTGSGSRTRPQPRSLPGERRPGLRTVPAIASTRRANMLTITPAAPRALSASPFCPVSADEGSAVVSPSGQTAAEKGQHEGSVRPSGQIQHLSLQPGDSQQQLPGHLQQPIAPTGHQRTSQRVEISLSTS